MKYKNPFLYQQTSPATRAGHRIVFGLNTPEYISWIFGRHEGDNNYDFGAIDQGWTIHYNGESCMSFTGKGSRANFIIQINTLIII